MFTPQTIKMSESADYQLDLDPQALQRVEGFSPVTRRFNAVQEARVAIASELWHDFCEGRVDPYLMRQAFHPTQEYAFNHLCRRYPGLFHESMTTSDFDSLTDTVVNRGIDAAWANLDHDYKRVVKVRDGIRDFRALPSYDITGLRGRWVENKELEGFDRDAAAQTKRSWSVKKYRKGFGMSWEAILSDNISMFRDFPQRLAEGAMHTRAHFVSSLYVGASGFDTTLFTSGQGNIIVDGATTNPPLSLSSFTAALKQFMAMEDDDDYPIALGKLILVVGNGSDLITARNIKNSLQIEMTTGGGSSDRKMIMNNWLAGEFEIMYNPWISKIATTANGSTTWFLFRDPGLGRAAVEFGNLAGFDSPVLYRKASNAVRLGGGVDDTVGSFETMSTEYMGVDVFGGDQWDYRGAMASNGSSS